jgi:glycosyltransferase involved in cell wall biosynthesis
MNMHIRRSASHTLPSKEAIWVRRKHREQFLDGTIKPKISLIIPARNEAKNLPWVMERIPAIVDEIILVDGNSTDDTIEVFQALCPKGIVMQQYANGKGSALATGLTAATGDIIVMIDADGSMDPIEIHGLAGALLSGADVVKSSRYVAGGGSDDISHLRNFGNQGLRIVSKVLFGHDWSELAYGYAAFWSDIIPSLHLEPIYAAGNPQSKKEYGRGFEIEALLFTRSQRLGLKVAEVFSFEYPRIFGVSNLSTFKDGWRVLMALFRERFTPLPMHPEQRLSPVLVVGSGSQFLSGISHYTAHLANSLAKSEVTALILMRNLIPKFLYPGRKRVGESTLSSIRYDDNVAVYNGVDWNGGKSLRGAKRFIDTTNPRVVVFQWWTAAVSWSYVSLAKAAFKNGAKIIVEFHEIQDVGEAKLPLTTRISNMNMKKMLTMASGIVVHSTSDLAAVINVHPTAAGLPYKVIPHGPYDALVDLEVVKEGRKTLSKKDPLKLMYFGVIRPYKGLDVLVDAYQKMRKNGDNVELTIVGEPWGAEAQETLNKATKGIDGDKIKVIPRYVKDAEIPYLMKDADVIVLPYVRSSASGPIALAMAAGMPLVTTDIPALMEASEGYEGAIHVPVSDVNALIEGIKQSKSLVGKHHDNPLSWEHIAEKYENLFNEIGAPNK